MIFWRFFWVPVPPQSLQGCSMMYPSPPQVWQVEATEKNPWLWRTCPEPEQAGQTFFPEPLAAPEPLQLGQGSFREY
jgi:hypothetical protein